MYEPWAGRAISKEKVMLITFNTYIRTNSIYGRFKLKAINFELAYNNDPISVINIPKEFQRPLF